MCIRDRVTLQGNANNIVSTNGVSNKVSSVSSNASYEEGEEEVVVIPSQGENNEISSESKEKSVLPVVVVGSDGTDAVSEQLYAGG